MGLFGSSDKTTTRNQESTTKVEMPSWIEDVQRGLLTDASELSKQGYNQYQGDRVAELTPDEQAAYQRIRDSIGSQGERFDVAANGLEDFIGSGRNGIQDHQIQQYMNPYRENVMDVSRRRAIEDFDRRKQELQNKAGQTAAFGGSRMGLAEAQLYDDFDQNLQDQEAAQLFQGYQQALGGAERGLQRSYQGSMGLADLGSAIQAYQLGDASALEGIGQVQRQLDQQGLDVNYQDFLQEEQHPYKQIEFLSNVSNPLANLYRGQTKKGTTTTTQKSGDSGFLGKALGVASLAAAPFTGGASLAGGSAGMQAMFGAAKSGLGALMGGGGSSGLSSGAISMGNQGALFRAEGGVVTKDRGLASLDNSYAEGGRIEATKKYWNNSPLGMLSNFINSGGNGLRSLVEYDPSSDPDSSMFQEQLAGIRDFVGSRSALSQDNREMIGGVEQAVKDYFTKGSNEREAEAKLREIDNLTKQMERDYQEDQLNKEKEATNKKEYEDVISKYANLPSPAEEDGSASKVKKDNKNTISASPAEASPSKQSETGKEEKGGINYPLLAFGAALLGSDNDFFKALGEGSQAAGQVAKQAEASEAEAAQNAFENQLAAQKLANNQRSTSIYERDINSQIEKRKLGNPMENALERLKLQEAIRKADRNSPEGRIRQLAAEIYNNNALLQNSDNGTELALQQAMQIEGYGREDKVAKSKDSGPSFPIGGVAALN